MTSQCWEYGEKQLGKIVYGTAMKIEKKKKM